jgi:hypothetical protein
MTPQTEITPLASLEIQPYLNQEGQIPTDLQRKIGVYAIFNQDQELQYVGYSRDIYLSLKQHLVRKPQQCYWFKVLTIERPNRTILEATRQAWLAENGAIPAGNGEEEAQWTQPIDAKPMMSEEEKETYAKSEPLGQSKLLKKVARRVEAEILGELEKRGVQMELRFQPKLKEQGLLDLK